MENKNKTQAYITFGLGEEKFALPVEHVHEIVELDRITQVPNSPVYMLGIINLRGKVLPLLDTRIKLGLPKAEATRKSRIMVLDIDTSDEKVIQIGALVDVAREVIELSPEDIQEAPELDNKVQTPITGVVNNKGDITLIMDIAKVFSTTDIVQLNQVMN
jgi:purine-binding chemotaxis protein CheW